jgi:hypothetical protein
LDDAVTMLAKRAVVARRVRGMRKQANPAAPAAPAAPKVPTPTATPDFSTRLQNAGGQFWNWLNEEGKSLPRWGMVGAGAGGLLGVLSSLNRKKEER